MYLSYTCIIMHVCYSKFSVKVAKMFMTLADMSDQSIPPLYQA
jgi:hypothetical protein